MGNLKRGYLEFSEDKEKGIVPHSMGVYGIAVNNIIKYVGSSLDFFKRKSNHLANLRGNKHPCEGLQELYNEFGEDAFTFTILMQSWNDKTGETLYELEKFCMQYFRKTILNYSNVVKEKKYIRTEEESRAISKKLSEINSGERNPNNRLTRNQAKEIIKMKEKGVRYKDIASKFNISEGHVNKIGKTRWLSIV